MYGYAGVYRRKFQTHFSYSIYIYISVQFIFYSIKEACEIIIPNFNCNYICTWLNEQVKRLSVTEEHRACVGPNYPICPIVSWKSFVWECTVFVLEQNKGSMYGKPRIAYILSCMYPTTVCILKFIIPKTWFPGINSRLCSMARTLDRKYIILSHRSGNTLMYEHFTPEWYTDNRGEAIACDLLVVRTRYVIFTLIYSFQ